MLDHLPGQYQGMTIKTLTSKRSICWNLQDIHGNIQPHSDMLSDIWQKDWTLAALRCYWLLNLANGLLNVEVKV
jgi:hypothetical protein